MFGTLFQNVSEEEKNTAIEGIIQHATPRPDFFLMLSLSVSMATFGVLLQNTVILIGSMLIAPLLFPLLSLGLGIVVADNSLIARSFYTLGKSVAFGLATAFFFGFLFAPRGVEPFPLDIVAGSASSLMYAVVAVIAGLAAAFATTKPHLNETLPGVAISVALVPPLAAAGIGLAIWDWAAISNAFLLFIVNVIGIVFSAMVVFSLLRFAVKGPVAADVVAEENKQMEREKVLAEAANEQDDTAVENPERVKPNEIAGADTSTSESSGPTA
jgi:uncharacterized hydrophobic protein (TIGR00271 family)